MWRTEFRKCVVSFEPVVVIVRNLSVRASQEDGEPKAARFQARRTAREE
jgi:hypothetical protein